jgi:outer membrane immunogenic protein
MRESRYGRAIEFALPLENWGYAMKKILGTLAALAAFTAPALAADMAAKAPPMRAAPVAYAPSWTGCYVAGGGGFGMWNQENGLYDNRIAGRPQLVADSTAGGRGYFGTVGAGCDYQFPVGNWGVVVGAFGDYDWASMKGRVAVPFAGNFDYGHEKLDSQWAIGGRIGVLITPNLLTYFSGGYTEAHFTGFQFLNGATANGPLGAPTPFGIYGQTYKGYFLGAGDEYALGILPGLFWKTEYRFSEFDTKSNPVRVLATGALAGGGAGLDYDSKKYVHTIRSELVYRFNWGGPVVAKY